MTDLLDPKGGPAWLAAYAIGLATSHRSAGDAGNACVRALVSAVDGDCARLEAAGRLLGQMEIVDYQLRADSHELMQRAADSCKRPKATISTGRKHGDDPCQ